MHIFEHTRLSDAPERRRRWGGWDMNVKGLVVGPPRFELGTSCTPSKKYQSLTEQSSLKTKDLSEAIWTPNGRQNAGNRAFGLHVDSATANRSNVVNPRGTPKTGQ